METVRKVEVLEEGKIFTANVWGCCVVCINYLM